MKDYVNDILVWAIIIAILVVIYFSIFKRRKNFLLLLGVLIMFASVPTGLMTEVSVSGCCGAPSSRFGGVGYVLIVPIFLLGLYITIKAAKKKDGSKPS